MAAAVGHHHGPWQWRLATALLVLLACAATAVAGPTVRYRHVGRTFLKEGEVRLLTDQDYYPALLDLIDGAREEIVMGMFLFKVGKHKNNRPARVAAALGRVARRGVQVTVVLERSDRDEKLQRANERAARRLKRDGVTVRFDTPRTTTHVKAVVVDHRYCLVGSHNLTQAALRYNHEVSILLDHHQTAQRLRRYLVGLH